MELPSQKNHRDNNISRKQFPRGKYKTNRRLPKMMKRDSNLPVDCIVLDRILLEQGLVLVSSKFQDSAKTP